MRSKLSGVEKENVWGLYERELQYLAGQEFIREKLQGRTVMVSGATGMIGKCLIDFLMLLNKTLEKPVDIIALSRNPHRAEERFAEYWKEECFGYAACDVNDGIPECGAVDYVIHAASNTHPLQYSEDSIGTIVSNVIGTKNLLDYAVSHHARQFCFVSSVEIYGENRGDTDKFSEGYLGYLDCNTLRAGYPESKRLGETLCNAYCHTHGLAFTIPRLSRVYGPTMLSSDSKAISQFIRKAADGEDIILKSEGTQKYSYTFVTDTISAVLYTMLLGQTGKAYNVADEDSDIMLKDLAGCLARIAGTEVVFRIPDEKEKLGYSTVTRAMLDASMLRELGWVPRVHISEGLECTVGTVRMQKDL